MISLYITEALKFLRFSVVIVYYTNTKDFRWGFKMSMDKDSISITVAYTCI